MNIEQFKARFQNRKVKKTLNTELQKVSLELQQESEALRVLVNSQGWKYLKSSFEKAIELYKNALKSINPAHTIDIIRLQEAIGAREALLSYVENRIKS